MKNALLAAAAGGFATVVIRSVQLLPSLTSAPQMAMKVLMGEDKSLAGRLRFDAGGVPMFYINLDRQPHRRLLMEADFGFCGDLTRIVAPDPLTDIESVAELIHDTKSRNGLCSGAQAKAVADMMGVMPGELALTLAHLKAIQTASRSKADHAMILEDGTSPILVPLWTTTIEEVIDDANFIEPDWHLIHLAYTMESHPIFVQVLKDLAAHPTETVRPLPVSVSGTGAYIVSRRGMKGILGQVEHGERFEVEGKAKSGRADLFLSSLVPLEKRLYALPPLFANRYLEGLTGIRDATMEEFQQRNNTAFVVAHEQSLADAACLAVRGFEMKRMLEFARQHDENPKYGDGWRNYTDLVWTAISSVPKTRWFLRK